MDCWREGLWENVQHRAEEMEMGKPNAQEASHNLADQDSIYSKTKATWCPYLILCGFKHPPGHTGESQK